MSVSGQEEKSFMKVTVDDEKPFFILQIDRKLIKETDKGSFVLKIKASDGKETVEYQISVSINYVVIKAEVEQTAAV